METPSYSPTEHSREFLQELFQLAISEADPTHSITAHLPPVPKGKIVVIGIGKASAVMAQAVEKYYGNVEGIVIVPYGYVKPCNNINIIEAAHPIPDDNGLQATERIIDLVSALGADDVVIALISGGGSSLLVNPIKGVLLSEKRDIYSALLKSGAPISEINTVRKQLSCVKGGKLAKICAPATIHSYLVSDIPGDKVDLIASGPTIINNDPQESAEVILQRWHIDVPTHILKAMQTTQIPQNNHSPSQNNTHQIIISPLGVLTAVKNYAIKQGCVVHFLGDALEGEARELGVKQAKFAKELAHTKKQDQPIIILSGGECTVSVTGEGSGGPNAEFVLSALLELDNHQDIYVLSCDSDGVDGKEYIAGAIAWPSLLQESRAQNLNPSTALINNDSHTFFTQMNASIISGPTFTNVNDIRIFLIL